MRNKREEARPAAAEARAKAAAAAEQVKRDLASCLRELGFRADEVRRAAAWCESIPDASLEERLRFALRCLCPKVASHRRAVKVMEAAT